jgi:hypothetical protein
MSSLICPITHDTIKEPVICPDGHTYEREALEKWVRQSGKSPVNPSLSVTLDQIFPNYAISSLYLPMTVNSVKQEITYLKPFIYSQNQDDGTIIVNIVNPESMMQIPRDCVFVVDGSGSMSTEAKMQSNNGNQSEDHGLSVWDITKHSVFTSLHTMRPEDRASIVLFSNTSTILTPLQPMTEQLRNSAIHKLNTKVPGGTTNLYSGIKQALSILDTRTDTSREATILLFTDGQPNERPPLGEIVEFERYIQQKEGKTPTLHTFGFGNDIIPDLLYKLSVIGNGSYNFIPDSSFLGTVFVNSMANIFSGYADNTRFISDSGNINLGSLQYGQNRWLVTKDKTFLTTFTQKNELHTIIGAGVNEECFLQKDDILSREWYLNTLRKCIELVSRQEFNDAQSLIKTCRQFIKETKYGTSLILDMEGEVTKAVMEKYFSKWGKNWLYSILRAHELQICNNFLDPGVQNYGGALYKKLLEKANTIFNSLPPPEPSILKATSVRCRSMSYYNNATSNPCFAGECLVEMGNGQLKKVEDIVKGDQVQTEFGISSVRCVLKTICKNSEADLVNITTRINPLRITPYHPIKWRKNWVYPDDLSNDYKTRFVQSCPAVYSFLLYGNDHTMIINNIIVITLAHGITEGLLNHWYYGTQKIVNFLSQCQGWNEGLVVLQPGCTQRDEKGNFKRLVYI